MVKKITKRKYNKTLIPKGHYHALGDFLFNEEGGKSLNNLSKAGEGILSATGTAIGQLGGSAIGGGLTSGVGSAFSGLGKIASAIPGPFGAIASAGLGVLGGLTNRMFGSKLNQENIAKVESNINELNQFQSGASDYDTLAQNWANASTGMTFDDSFIGKDGWFSNKAKKKANELRNKITAGNTWVQNSLVNNADNISGTQMQNLLANYSAYGGPLYANGGSIYIKPNKKGTFTAAAKSHNMGVQEFANKVLSNKENYSPAMVKKANFAKNAANWKHAFGGDLMTHGADFSTGITLVNNGGTHEENPNEGVPMGMDEQGIPNLVEEGEVIFNDYVFSKRLRVPDAIRNKYKLRGTKSLSFADAALQMSKEAEERPNDPISKAGLNNSMTKLMMAQEEVRAKEEQNNDMKRNIFAIGGKKNPTATKEGYYREIDEKLRQSSDPKLRMMGYNHPNIVNGSFVTSPLENLANNYQKALGIKELKPPTEIYNPIPIPQNRPSRSYTLEPTWMRYVPAYASGMLSLTDALGLTNKPDYGEAQAVLEASKGAGIYNPVKFNPIGNYLSYTPFDRDYYSNKLEASAGAARRALMNTSGGNRATAMAGLLAADYNTQSKLGDLYRQAEEYNLAQRQKTEEFNRATDMYNSEGIFKADSANQAALMNARSSYLKGALTAADIRQRERQQSTAAKSANLSNFINSLGDIGRENFSRNMIVSDPSKYYSINNSGEITYNKDFYGLDAGAQDYIQYNAWKKQQARNNKQSKSKGGYLTINKRRK